MKYLVQSHEESKRLFISNYNPEDRTSSFISSEERDKTIFSWNEEGNGEIITKLVEYLISDEINTKEDIENEIQMNGVTETDYTSVVRSLIKTIAFNNVMLKMYLKSLRNIRYISKKQLNDLNDILSISLKNQIYYVRNFDYSEINIKDLVKDNTKTRKLYLMSTK